MNLIIWGRNSAFRLAAAYGFVSPDGYPKEKEDLMGVEKCCLSKTNDADYEIRLTESCMETKRILI
jgi:hypothetical protein